MNELTRLVISRSKRLIAAALVLAAVGIAAGTSLSDRLAPFAAEDPHSESVQADELLARAGVTAGVEVVALIKTPQGASSLLGRAQAAAVAHDLHVAPDIGRVITPAQGGRSMIAKDGRSAYVAASFRPGVDDIEASQRLLDRFADDRGVLLGGQRLRAPR